MNLRTLIPTIPAFVATRLGPLVGVVGSGLVVAGLMKANSVTETTGPSDTAATIAAAHAAAVDGTRAGVSVALAGSALLLWFLGYLRHEIGRAEGPDGWLHSVAHGGGLVGLAGLGIYLAILVAGSNDSIGGSPDAASSLLFLQWEFGGVLAPAYAALVGASSVAAIRYRMLPAALAWIAWLGLPLGLALAFAGFLGGALVVTSLLWLVALSVAWTIRPPGDVDAAAPVARPAEA